LVSIKKRRILFIMPSPSLPHIYSVLADITTPLRLFEVLSADQPQAILLESTDGDSRLARYSIIGWKPSLRVAFRDGMVSVLKTDGTHSQAPCTNPLAYMQTKQAHFLASHGLTESDLKKIPQFTGGWLGYLGYNATQYFEPSVTPQAEDVLQVPDAAFGFYDVVLEFDHLKRTLSLVSYRPQSETDAIWQQVLHAIGSASTGFSPLPASLVVPEDTETLFSTYSGPFTKTSFLDAVGQCKALIVAGEVFQIVLAQRFSKRFEGNHPLDVYRTLIATNPSPYSYVLKFPDFYYVGSSPETFVQYQNGAVVLRALAGTRPRGVSEAEDLALANELRHDEKELAEHRMLVDLARNDLGKVCEVGTITVGELAQIHYYTHVMHLATEVSGTLKPEFSAYDVVRSVLPRGTVSGAPKIRAMQHLSVLEPERRGIYAGAIGFFDLAGNTNTCIAIRSALIKGGHVHVQAGAGIVYDSQTIAEYEETRNKAKSVVKAVYWAEQSAQFTPAIKKES
jgi:anthranilate synthase component I